MGEFSSLGYDVDCYCVAPVSLGAHSTVSQYSFLCTASHDVSDPHMRLTSAPIEIGDQAWVCADVFVALVSDLGKGLSPALVQSSCETSPLGRLWWAILPLKSTSAA